MKNNVFLRQLGEYYDMFLPNIHSVSPNTAFAYAGSFAVFFEFLYESKGLKHTLVTYKQHTPALVDEFLLWMMNHRKYSVPSIRQRMTAIASFLKYVSRREMVAVSAYTGAATTERPDTIRTEFPYFTVEEMKLLLALPNPEKHLGDHDLVLLPLLYETGSRAQEICDLCVGDIRFTKPTKVKLHGKGSKALHMVEAGVNLIYIRNFLGHESISSTEIYARADRRQSIRL